LHRFAWRHHRYAKSLCRQTKVTQIEGDDCIGPAVDRRFQDHIVIGVRQRRAPQIGQLDRLGHGSNCIKQHRNIGRRKAGGAEMLSSSHDRFIFYPDVIPNVTAIWDRRYNNARDRDVQTMAVGARF
jgi:hypothetical protein